MKKYLFAALTLPMLSVLALPVSSAPEYIAHSTVEILDDDGNIIECQEEHCHGDA